MHQSFTGSTRKTRQVNLGGRAAANPWAALPGSTKSSHGSSATQSTIAQAQADRLRRQHEREKVTAARRVQQTWRGHSSRRKQKARWRYEFDENEQARNHMKQIHYENVLDSGFDFRNYDSSEQLFHQLRLLVRSQEFRVGIVMNQYDTERVLYFGKALRLSSSVLTASDLEKQRINNLSKFGLVVARHINSTLLLPWTPAHDKIVTQLSQVLSFLISFVPNVIQHHALAYFQSLRRVIGSGASQTTYDAVVGALLALLSAAVHDTIRLYAVFAHEFLSDKEISKDARILDRLAMELNLSRLATAMSGLATEKQHTSSLSQNVNAELWQLSYLIYFRKRNQKSGVAFDSENEAQYIQALSIILNLCANVVADLLDTQNGTEIGSRTKPSRDLDPFILENISLLAREDNIKAVISILSQSRSQSRSNHSGFEEAKLLANYAVAVLRAFPSKATNIRMWLYQGSITLSSGRDVSIMQYFWSIASTTAVFKKIAQNQRNVLSVLKEAAPESNQIGRSSSSPEQINRWREEWRIVLLFFELYSFVLKLMDDEDFFSLEKSERYGSDTMSNHFKRAALPLSDIALMTTFLKNLAFTLYWNAADLVETNHVEESGGIAALFGSPSTEQETSRTTDKSRLRTLTGNGVSQTYLKNLSTGLLRMLHERDSRRNFLPQNHWLMTSQVDMAAFIPAVTVEEEKRHELGDEDLEDEEDVEMVSNDTTHLNDPMGSSLLSSMFGIREPHTPRSMASRHADRLERQRVQARKRRQLESLAPRLEILRNLPFFIPFETRVQIFREFIFNDQLRRREGFVDADNWRMNVASTTQGRGLDGRPRGFDVISRQHAEIHRESVFEDAYSQFYELGEGLKEPIQISFIDKFGAPEAGIDGGGVTKEFLMSVTSEAFDPKGELSMFQENEQRYLYPNPVIFEETSEHLHRAGLAVGSENFNWHMREFLRRFEFLGRVVGKCLYEGILIDVSFAGFFLLKWALTGGSTSASNESAYRATINDLRDYDEELYQGLLKLKNYPGDVEADFSLNFTISDTLRIEDDNGVETSTTVTRDLVTNGAEVSITNSNRLVYIDRVVRYRLQEQPRLVTNAFLKGLSQIIQPSWLAMFNQKELQKLVGGDNTELDIADLRRNTLYGGLYVIGDDGLEHPTVELFWKVLKEMDDSDRRKVLKFVTSTPRAPLLGFSHLNPKFSIRDSSEDQDRLPSTSTCVNLLKLPRYGDKHTMKQKLLYAVNSGAGFDLS